MRRFQLGASLIALTACCFTVEAAAQEAAASKPEGEQSFDGITTQREGAGPAPATEAAQGEQDANQTVQDNGRPKGAATLPTRKRRPAPSDPNEILVTGSRLNGGDTTSNTKVITRQDIERRGVTTVEELLRTLPENISTIGAITNERARGPLRQRSTSGGDRNVSFMGSLGVSAANLGGMGAGNTLILVNGRRVAGAAGIEDGFANLNGIPLSAVERVEINTGGASAIYGSDALGGVINFILRKNYVGTTISGQYEHSANDADSKRVSIYSGYAWGSGSLSGTASYRESDPVNNWKSGYRTQNYSDYYNDPRYDYRSFTNGAQPGVIDMPEYVFDPVTFNYSVIPHALTVRDGFSGRPALSDFITVGSEALRDYVPELAGPKSKTFSLSYDFEQKITDKLKVFSSGLYTRATNRQEQPAGGGLSLALAPGQYYNPFPAYYIDGYNVGTTVYYYPRAEVANGDVDFGSISNRTEQWSINAGLSYQFNKDTLFEFIYTRSRSSAKARSDNFSSLVSINNDPTAPGGYSCYNYFVANPSFYRGTDFANYRDVFNRQCTALTSSDPSVAFNPWSSTGTGGGGISPFLWNDARENRSSTLQNFEARLRGGLLRLPGGTVNYALGGEYNTDGVNSREVNIFTGAAVSRDRHALFGELSVPVFGDDFTLPGLRQLNFDVALRRDVYNTDGAIGTVGGIPIDQGGEIIFGKNSFKRTTPAFGVRWSPIEGLVLRSRWSRGFRAPPFTQLFNVAGSMVRTTTIVNDPLYTCTSDCSIIYPDGRRVYMVPLTTAPNPDLRAQTSKQQMYNLQFRPGGALRGLSVDITYNRTRISNEYADRDDLSEFLPIEQQYQLAQFFPRDANGKIIGSQNMIFNVSGSEYSSIQYVVSYLVNAGKFGSFEPRLTYQDNLKAERRAFPNSAVVSTLGKLQGPDRYRIIGELNWYFNDLTMTLWGYHTPSYTNDYELVTSAGVIRNPELSKPVSAYTTFDLTATWKVNNAMRLNFAGRNIFKADPPFVVVGDRPYDTARYNAAGRTLSLELQYTF